MINKIRQIAIIAAITTSSTLCSAQGLLDTRYPYKLITKGVRVGITTSNVAPNYDKIFSDIAIVNGTWRNGFNMGYVIDLNIRNFLSIQPGAFFANKSYDTSIISINQSSNYFSCVERHSRFYYLQIPIMASLKLDLFPGLKGVVEFGPYYAYGLGGNTKINEFTNLGVDDNKVIRDNKYSYSYYGDGSMKLIQMKHNDWGWKMGIGLRFMHKYSIYAHYLAGRENIAKQNSGYQTHAIARNKEWNFTLGYDF